MWAAKRLRVFCGTSSLTWLEYRSAMGVNIGPDPAINHLLPVRSFLGAKKPYLSSEQRLCFRSLRNRIETAEMINLRNATEGHDAHEILRLLNESTRCLTSNKHDRIYALVGMANVPEPIDQGERSGSGMALPVHYNIPIEALYRRVAMSLMRSAGPWCILATDGSFGRATGFDLPSWTPDFEHSTQCKLRPSHRRPDRRRDGRERLFRFRRLNPIVTSSVLRLEGLRIATSK